MALKAVKKTVFHVEHWDLEEFICEVYGKDEYSFVEDAEVQNYSSKEFSLNKEPLDERDTNILNRFIEGHSPQYIIRILLQDMCNRDLIEEGDYIIKVFW